MNKFADRLKDRMIEMGISTQQELADLTGISKAAIHNYITGRAQPGSRQLAKLANALVTSTDYLLSFTNVPTPSKLRNESNAKISDVSGLFKTAITMVPVLGWASAGKGEWAEDEITEYIPVPKVSGLPRDLVWATKVIGDSMSPTIIPGDIVVIYKDPASVSNNDIVLAILEESLSFLKRIRFQDGGRQIILYSDNNRYPPIVHFRDDVRIIGKVISLYRTPK
jgi:SOS-response transcriptional repressor LexA